jgi:cation transport regulator ChaC
MSGVIAFMIQQGTALFNIPPKLATDIRAYLAERERRKLSPKKEVDKHVTVVVDSSRNGMAHDAREGK